MEQIQTQFAPIFASGIALKYKVEKIAKKRERKKKNECQKLEKIEYMFLFNRGKTVMMY